jgi:ribosomal protein S18 acetylase RimI-like enzyme
MALDGAPTPPVSAVLLRHPGSRPGKTGQDDDKSLSTPAGTCCCWALRVRHSVRVAAPVIRPYTESDRAQVLAVDASITVESVLHVHREGDSFLIETEPLDRPTVKAFDLSTELADAAWDSAWVAAGPAAIVGFAATRFEDWNRRQVLLHLYVSQAFRRRGIGRELVWEAVRQGRANEADHLWLETSSANAPAVRAYEHMGFSLCGLDVTLYDGTTARGEIGLFMSQPLTPG